MSLRQFVLPTALPLVLAGTVGCGQAPADGSDDDTSTADENGENGENGGSVDHRGVWYGVTWTNYGEQIDFPYGNEGDVTWDWTLTVRESGRAGGIDVVLLGDHEGEDDVTWPVSFEVPEDGPLVMKGTFLFNSEASYDCYVTEHEMDCIAHDVEEFVSLSAMSFDRAPRD